VLARGYALVTADGHPVTKAAGLRSGQQVDLTFGDGSCRAIIGGQPAQGLLDL
jgi:exodeoxyribonuclease VII large subunit